VKRKELLRLVVGISLVLVLALALPLMSACAPAVPEEAAEEIAALESKLAAEKSKVSSLQGDVSDLEDEVAALRAPAEVYEWRLQHTWSAVENHFFEHYAAVVKEMTNGRIDLAVFSDGEIVTFEELPSSVAMGMLNMGHTHPEYHCGVLPEGKLGNAPFLFTSHDEEMAFVHRFGAGDIWREGFAEEFGIHILDFEPDDYGAIMMTEDFETLADLEGRRLNIGGFLATAMAEAAGTEATYLEPEEIYTSLALGVLDGAEYGGAKCMYEMGFHEVAKYFMMPYHHTVHFPFYFINPELYEGLPSDLQAILMEAIDANGVYMRSFYVAEEAKALDMMRDEGVKVVYLSDEDVAKLTGAMIELLEEMRSESPRCERIVDAAFEALKAFGRY